ncbi:MAG: glycosyltransferase family 2 protein [Acidimicrobiia bacterium]|nr:glycosyltransferase family 2 protein [Acidimicrobiia bacterium]MDH3470471.1 glycosyltransferase family 2 protein [Acidimicrobiia bacterium]
MSRVTASVVIVTYNSERHIGACLAALMDDPAGPEQIIVVDNASSDNTTAIVAGYPVELIAAEENLGLAAGCHRGVEAASFDTLAFVTPDVVVRPGWLPLLVDALGDDSVGSATATLELAAQPGTTNTTGGELSYFGLAWASEIGSSLDAGSDLVTVPFTPGAAMAMKRSVWERSGGFRPELGMYHEDVDLGWRLSTLGLSSVRVPRSVVVHDYDFSRNSEKMFLLERNRLVLLWSNYRRGTLVLLVPALVLVEIGVLVVAVRDGWAGAKLRSWPAAWRQRRSIQQWYRRIQQERTVGDATLLEAMGSSFGGITEVRVPRGARLAGRILGGYRKLVLPVVRRADRRLELI